MADVQVGVVRERRILIQSDSIPVRDKERAVERAVAVDDLREIYCGGFLAESRLDYPPHRAIRQAVARIVTGAAQREGAEDAFGHRPLPVSRQVTIDRSGVRIQDRLKLRTVGDVRGVGVARTLLRPNRRILIILLIDGLLRGCGCFVMHLPEAHQGVLHLRQRVSLLVNAGYGIQQMVDERRLHAELE